MRPAPIDPPEVHHKLWEGYGGDVGWDIGANCGQTLPEMTKRFSDVYAFEPAEECWPFLEKFEGVNLLKFAVSDENADIQLVALPDKINTGQLVTGNCIGMEWNPNDPNAVARTLKAKTVDTLVSELGVPDFMKIDVEGHEEKVLKGAAETLVEYTPDLLIEFHSPELYQYCIELISSLKYELVETVRHPHYPADSWLWHQHGWIKAFA